MILKVVGWQAYCCTDEGAGKFGNEFFESVARVTKAGLTEVSV
jgi:hypothetical protein